MALRAILLDALGTLVALEPPAPRLTALIRERHGVEVAPADVERALRAEMGHYRAHCVRAADAARLAELRLECAAILAGELGGVLAELPSERFVATLLDSLRFHAFAEVPAALAAWRADGLALVVASNWDVSLHDVLGATGLRGQLDDVVTSAEVGIAKPAPELFEAALAAAGVAPGEAIHVGDSLAEDVEGAAAAGIRPVWLRRSGDQPAPAGVSVIAALDELVPVL